MDLSSRWYKAAGASIIAGAITARYVAKWRRRRSLRREGAVARETPGRRYFVGLDLADPNAANPRPSDIAVLDPDLRCTFDRWVYRENGSGIIPVAALGRAFLLAVDGPQGLAGEEEAVVRASERIVNAPGRTPFALPVNGRPYAGLISGSVKLFHQLVTSGARFRLLGMDGVAAHEANLIEVFPGGGWKTVASDPLPAKRSTEGRRIRRGLLEALGVQFPSDELPTVDQLDAAMAAWTAYCLNQGRARIEGLAPVMDREAGALREGYIVQPAPAAAGGREPNGIIEPV